MRSASFNQRVRTKLLFALLTAMILLLAACGGRKKNADADAEGRLSEEQETHSDQHYAGTVAAKEAPNGESPYYGIMHASVLEINGKINESDTVYSFKDKSDPENGWSVTGLEIGAIETELSVGADVVILFHGDIINDSENVDFMVILPEGSYELRKLEGTTINNTMSTFTVKTTSGQQIQLAKDNCRIDNGAMSADGGDLVIVYYADGAKGKYPLRVFKGE